MGCLYKKVFIRLSDSIGFAMNLKSFAIAIMKTHAEKKKRNKEKTIK